MQQVKGVAGLTEQDKPRLFKPRDPTWSKGHTEDCLCVTPITLEAHNTNQRRTSHTSAARIVCQ